VKNRIAAVVAEARAALVVMAVGNVRKLEGSPAYYRIRPGGKRIGIRNQENKLGFMRCLHRKDIYRYFP
jgi:mRNA interferase RelE/StbE